jgi:hypothetical protein
LRLPPAGSSGECRFPLPPLQKPRFRLRPNAAGWVTDSGHVRFCGKAPESGRSSIGQHLPLICHVC